MIKNEHVRQLTLTALFTAMSCVVTMTVMLPSPTGGYINPGDAVVLLGAFLLGPKKGALAGGIGSALADLLAGYTLYVPATLAIKMAMAFVAGSIVKKHGANLRNVSISAAIGELIMVVGYFGYTAVFLDMGSGAFVEVPGNIVQGVFGAIASVAMFSALIKIPYVRGLTRK